MRELIDWRKASQRRGYHTTASLENYTVSEIRKTWHNSVKECLLHYYRDKDTNEIDMVIETDGSGD